MLIAALDSEVPPRLPDDWLVVFTGVGKINASHHLTKAIGQHRPSQLINYGTAGALTQGLRGIVEVGSVIQYDMDVSPLGVAVGQTPFDDCPARLRLSASKVICGTADRFATSPPPLSCDIVDMELFALAKIAWLEGIPLRAFKYISDKADDSAAAEWTSSLSASAQAFSALARQLDK